ncbi:MAG TPA: hypothetical protein VEH53_04835, partial [archaeon]|nr:hypothetical protein [archaeon]
VQSPIWEGVQPESATLVQAQLDARIPIIASPDWIHLFVAGGEAGRFSAFIPGWGHMSAPVLRSIDGRAPVTRPECVDGTCAL